jgi:hypothetical protein
VDDRALFDMGSLRAGRTSKLPEVLFDRELHVGPISAERENPDLFEAHQGPDDLARVGDDEGASGTLAHTTTPEHLHQFLGDLRQGAAPPESEEPPDSDGPLKLVRPVGFEPTTCGLRVRCSAVELEAHRRV